MCCAKPSVYEKYLLNMQCFTKKNKFTFGK